MSILVQDRKSLGVVIFAAVGWAFFSLGYLFQPFGPASRTWFVDIGTLLAAWSVVILAYRLWRSYDPGEVSKGIWLAMLIGFLLWGCGEALWSYFDLQTGAELPYPSVADLAWSLGYPALWIALWLRYRSLEVPPGRRQWLALALIALVGLVAVRYVLWPILTYTEYGRLIEQILSVLYPVGDVILFAGAVLVASAVRGGRLSSPWQIIALGMAALGLADLAFAYATWNEIYVEQGPLNLVTAFTDIVYMGAYVVIAVGEFTLGRIERNA